VPDEIRPATAEEYADFIRTTFTAFGGAPTDEMIADNLINGELDRSLGALEGGRWVGAAGAFSFDMTLPGCTTAPVAGVTWVGVLPTHRRRGILTALMQRQLDDVVARGEPMAVLTASEALIYPRYGYGLASQYAGIEVDTRRAALHVPVRDDGRLRLVDKEGAAKIQPPLFDAYRRTRPGELSRNDRFWEVIFLDREHSRDGYSAHFHVVHETPVGEADGYARYRMKEEWDSSGPSSTVYVIEVVGADPEVEAALWRYLLELDLIRTLKAARRPLDDWLRWRLADSRAYKTTHIGDWLWVRPLDTAAALSARRYASEGTLVLEVADAFRPDGAAAGRFRLDGSPAGATCVRVDAAGPDADLSLDVVALGAAYLGGVSFRSLAEAGRVHADAAALSRADALFASTPLPYCSTPF